MNSIIKDIIDLNFINNKNIYYVKILEQNIYKILKNFINYLLKINLDNFCYNDNIFNFGILIVLISYLFNLIF